MSDVTVRRDREQERSQATLLHPSAGNDNAESMQTARETANDTPGHSLPHAWAQPFPLTGGPALLNTRHSLSK